MFIKTVTQQEQASEASRRATWVLCNHKKTLSDTKIMCLSVILDGKLKACREDRSNMFILQLYIVLHVPILYLEQW